jgi:hypothetical protein
MNRAAAIAASWESATAAAEASAVAANIAVLLAFEVDGVDDRLRALRSCDTQTSLRTPNPAHPDR